MGRTFILTGGIGSGKTTAGRVFARLGADVISADDAGHAVLDPDGEAFTDVAERWPAVIVDGTVERAALAAVVFSNPQELAALEEMTHPAIRSRVEAARQRSPAQVVLVEVPLLTVFEREWPTIVVDAPLETRVERLRGRGLSEEDIAARMTSQPTRGEWLAAADLVIDNSGDLRALDEECRFVWGWMTRS